jgi:hypothetical protein
MSRSEFPIWVLVVAAIGLVALLTAVVTTSWWVLAVLGRTRRRADEAERRLRAESDGGSF